MATLLQLKSLLAVVDRGSFTAASQELGMSQPAVSRSIATLEKELGLPLLARQRDGVLPTEAGARALIHAREAVRQLDLMRTEVAAMAGHVTGILRVASLPSATGTLIAVQLRAFTERHPRVTVRLLEGSDQEVRDWLDQGAADVAVVSLPAPGLTTAALGSQEMVAVVPVGHRLAVRDEVSYADLAREPFIRSTGGCAQVFTPVARQLGVELDVAFEAREMSAVLEMVRAGLGVSILPTAGLPDLPGGIVTRPLVPKTTRHLAVAVSASASPAARAFLDQIDALAVGACARATSQN
jgi:DNA-binding transcriptional LysR family regulator